MASASVHPKTHHCIILPTWPTQGLSGNSLALQRFIILISSLRHAMKSLATFTSLLASAFDLFSSKSFPALKSSFSVIWIRQDLDGILQGNGQWMNESKKIK